MELKFYASAVRDASEVQVRIDGEETPVQYAGRLHEVSALVPRSLEGSGEADVVLTADGQTVIRPSLIRNP